MRASARRWFGLVAVSGWMATGCAPHGPRPERAGDDEAPRVAVAPVVCSARESAGEGRMNLAEAEAEGERDAVLDLARGVMALEAFGRPRPCHAELAARLHDEYAIAFRAVGACAVTDAIVGHARGYNAKMHAYISQRHGAAVEAVARRAGCFNERPRRGWP